MNYIHFTPDPSLRLIPLPKPGETCPISGFSRATMYELTKGSNPRVATVRVKTGTGKGRRLVSVASLFQFLYSKGEVSGDLPESTKQALAKLVLDQSGSDGLAVDSGQACLASSVTGSGESTCKANAEAVFYGTLGPKPSFADVVSELVADGYPDVVAKSMAYVSFPEMLGTDETGLPA